MTPEELQRQEEVEWAARFFQHHFGEVPSFEDLPTNSRPDVCVRFRGKRIGVELTRATNPTLAVFDSFSEAFLASAHARHMELGGMYGRVTVSLHPRIEPNRYHRRQLGAKLGEVVAQKWTTPDGITIISSRDLPKELQPLVIEVRAFAHEGATFAHWNSPAAAWVQPINAERLQPIIDAKACLLPEYRKMGRDEVWLLIYARFGKTAEMFDEAAGFQPRALTSDFDRTFFYDFWRSHELAVP